MTVEEFITKLQTAVEKSTVGVELWFGSEEWLDMKAEGHSFMEFAAEMLNREV